MERRIETIARLWQAHPDFGRDVPGICTENENSVTRENCFLDVVRHHEYGLGAQLASVRNVSAVRTSSAENGSSMRSNIGLLTIALAKPARWLIPPPKVRADRRTGSRQGRQGRLPTWPGYTAKVWNTTAMPSARPASGVPR
jgi:hypothetical protein